MRPAALGPSMISERTLRNIRHARIVRRSPSSRRHARFIGRPVVGQNPTLEAAA